MLAQRMMAQSARRLATQQRLSVLSRYPQAIIASQFSSSQRRLAETIKVPDTEARDSILARQRLNRPVAPHLAIYKWQTTWILSALNRITGSILSGTFYVFGAAYVAAPLFGWNLTSASIAAAFAAWPAFLQVATKLFFALPFTFHSFNGLRHLAWDTGRTFRNSQVVQTGWTVVGLSVVTALGLALI